MTPQDSCAALARLLPQRGWMMASAESCTGGLIAAACTDLAGSSVWFERGFVTYSNAAKSELLGVAPQLIAQHGAVSEAVARAMALGALRHSQAQVALAVTGIAGPGGGTPDKPVGLVFVAVAGPRGECVQRMLLDGDRDAIRRQAADAALRMLLAAVTEHAV